MSWKPIFDLLDLGILMWIALMERAALKLERANHTLYSTFFAERTKWYASRGNKKAPEVSGGDAIVEVVSEISNEEAS